MTLNRNRKEPNKNAKSITEVIKPANKDKKQPGVSKQPAVDTAQSLIDITDYQVTDIGGLDIIDTDYSKIPSEINSGLKSSIDKIQNIVKPLAMETGATLHYVYDTIKTGLMPATRAQNEKYNTKTKDRAKVYFQNISAQLRIGLKESKYHKMQLKRTGFQFGTVYVTSPIKSIKLQDKKNSAAIDTIRTQEPMTFRPVRAQSSKYVVITIEFPSEVEINTEFRQIYAQYLAFPYTQIRNKDIARLVLPIDSNMDMYYTYFPKLAREYANHADINMKTTVDATGRVIGKFKPSDIKEWDPKDAAKKRAEIMDKMYSEIPLFFNISSITVDPISSSPDAMTVTFELLLGDLEPISRGKRLRFFTHMNGVLEQAGKWTNIMFSNYMPRSPLSQTLLKFKPISLRAYNNNIFNILALKDRKWIYRAAASPSLAMLPDVTTKKDENNPNQTLYKMWDKVGIMDIAMVPDGLSTSMLIGKDEEHLSKIVPAFNYKYDKVKTRQHNLNSQDGNQDWYDPRIVNMLFVRLQDTEHYMVDNGGFVDRGTDSSIAGSVHLLSFIYNGGHLIPIHARPKYRTAPILGLSPDTGLPIYSQLTDSNPTGMPDLAGAALMNLDETNIAPGRWLMIPNSNAQSRTFSTNSNFNSGLFFYQSAIVDTLDPPKPAKLMEEKEEKEITKWKKLSINDILDYQQRTGPMGSDWFDWPLKSIPYEYALAKLKDQNDPIPENLSISADISNDSTWARNLNLLSTQDNDNYTNYQQETRINGFYGLYTGLRDWIKDSGGIVKFIYMAAGNASYYFNHKLDEYNKLDFKGGLVGGFNKEGIKFRLLHNQPKKPTEVIQESNISLNNALTYELYFLQNTELKTIYPILLVQLKDADNVNDTRLDFKEEIGIISMLPIYSNLHQSIINSNYLTGKNAEDAQEKYANLMKELSSALDSSNDTDLSNWVIDYVQHQSFRVDSHLDSELNKAIVDRYPDFIGKLKNSIFLFLKGFKSYFRAALTTDNAMDLNVVDVAPPSDQEDTTVNLNDAAIDFIQAKDATSYNIPPAYLTDNLAMSKPFIQYYTTMLPEYFDRNDIASKATYNHINYWLKKRAPHLLPGQPPLETMGSYPVIYPYKEGINDQIILSYRTVSNSSYFGSLLEVDVNSILTVFNETLSHYIDKYTSKLIPKKISDVSDILNKFGSKYKDQGTETFNYITLDGEPILDAVDLNNELYRVTKAILFEIKKQVSMIVERLNTIDGFRNKYNRLVDKITKVSDDKYLKTKHAIQYIPTKKEHRKTTKRKIVTNTSLKGSLNIKNILVLGDTTATKTYSFPGKLYTKLQKTYPNNTLKVETPKDLDNKNLNAVKLTRAINNGQVSGIGKADIVIVSIGSNDMGDFAKLQETNVLNRYITLLTTIKNKIKQNARIVFINVPNFAYGKIKQDDIENFNNAIAQRIKNHSDLKDRVTIINAFNGLTIQTARKTKRGTTANDRKSKNINGEQSDKLAGLIFSKLAYGQDDVATNVPTQNTSENTIPAERAIFNDTEIYASYYDYIMHYFAHINLIGLEILDEFKRTLNTQVGKSLRSFADEMEYYTTYYTYMAKMIQSKNLTLPSTDDFKKLVNKTILKRLSETQKNPDKQKLIQDERYAEYRTLKNIQTVVKQLRLLTKAAAIKLKKQTERQIYEDGRIFLIPNIVDGFIGQLNVFEQLASYLNYGTNKFKISDKLLKTTRSQIKQLSTTYPSFRNTDLLKWKNLTIQNKEEGGTYTVIDSYNIATVNNSIPIHMDGHDNPEIINLGGPSKNISLSIVTNDVNLLDGLANMAVDYNIPMRKYNLLKGLSPLASRAIKDHSVKNELIYDARTNSILAKFRKANNDPSVLNSTTSDTPIFITNEIANMVGVQAIVLDNITYDTVPDTTNTFVISMSFRAVDPKQMDRETPTKRLDILDNFFILSDFSSFVSGIWFPNGENNVEKAGGINTLINMTARNVEKVAAGVAFFYLLQSGKLKDVYNAINNLGEPVPSGKDDTLIYNLAPITDIILGKLNETLIADFIGEIKTNDKKQIEINFGRLLNDAITRAHNILYTLTSNINNISIVRTKETKDVKTITKNEREKIRNTICGDISSDLIEKYKWDTILDKTKNNDLAKLFVNDSFISTFLTYLVTYYLQPLYVYDELQHIEESMVDHNDGKLFGMAIFTTIIARSLPLHTNLLYALSYHYDAIQKTYQQRINALSKIKTQLSRRQLKTILRTINKANYYKNVYKRWVFDINQTIGLIESKTNTNSFIRSKLANNYDPKKLLFPQNTSSNDDAHSFTNVLKNTVMITRKIVDLYMMGLTPRSDIQNMLCAITYNKDNYPNATWKYEHMGGRGVSVKTKLEANKITTDAVYSNTYTINNKIYNVASGNQNTSRVPDIDAVDLTKYKSWFFRNTVVPNDNQYIKLSTFRYFIDAMKDEQAGIQIKTKQPIKTKKPKPPTSQSQGSSNTARIVRIGETVIKALLLAVETLAPHLAFIYKTAQSLYGIYNLVRGMITKTEKALGLNGIYGRALFVSLRLMGLFTRYVTLPYLSFILRKHALTQFRQIQIMRKKEHTYVKQGVARIKDQLNDILTKDNDDILLYSIRTVFFLVKDIIDDPIYQKTMYDRFNAYQDRPLPIILKTNDKKFLKRFNDNKYIDFNNTNAAQILNMINFITSPDFFVYKDPILLTAEYNVMKAMLGQMLDEQSETEPIQQTGTDTRFDINADYKNKLKDMSNLLVQNAKKEARALVDALQKISSTVTILSPPSNNQEPPPSVQKVNAAVNKAITALYDVIDSIDMALMDDQSPSRVKTPLQDMQTEINNISTEVNSLLASQSGSNNPAAQISRNRVLASADMRAVVTAASKFNRDVLSMLRILRINQKGLLTKTEKIFLDNIFNASAAAYTDESLKVMAKKLDMTRIVNSKVIQPGTFGHSLPTFKLYILEQNENRFLAFNDFYSYASVKSIAIHRSKKMATSTAVIEVTNVYGKLTDILNARLRTENPLATRPNEKENLSSFMLKPGAMIQIRLGFSGYLGPESVVFSGEVASIKGQEVLTITAQGWGSQLTKPIGNGRGFDLAGGFIESFFMNTYTAAGTIMALMDLPEEGIHHLGGVDPLMGQLLANRRTINAYASLWKKKMMNFIGSQIENLTGVPTSMVDTTLTNISLADDANDKIFSWGQRRWLVYNETVWDALSDYILQFPGYKIKIAEMDEEGTIVIGKTTDIYQYTYEYNMFTDQVAPLISSLRQGLEYPPAGFKLLTSIIKRESMEWRAKLGGKIKSNEIPLGPIGQLFAKSIDKFMETYPFSGAIQSVYDLKNQTGMGGGFGRLLVTSLIDPSIKLVNERNIYGDSLIGILAGSYKMSEGEWQKALQELNNPFPDDEVITPATNSTSSSNNAQDSKETKTIRINGRDILGMFSKFNVKSGQGFTSDEIDIIYKAFHGQAGQGRQTTCVKIKPDDYKVLAAVSILVSNKMKSNAKEVGTVQCANACNSVQMKYDEGKKLLGIWNSVPMKPTNDGVDWDSIVNWIPSKPRKSLSIEFYYNIALLRDIFARANKSNSKYKRVIENIDPLSLLLVINNESKIRSFKLGQIKKTDIRKHTKRDSCPTGTITFSDGSVYSDVYNVTDIKSTSKYNLGLLLSQTINATIITLTNAKDTWAKGSQNYDKDANGKEYLKDDIIRKLFNGSWGHTKKKNKIPLNTFDAGKLMVDLYDIPTTRAYGQTSDDYWVPRNLRNFALFQWALVIQYARSVLDKSDYAKNNPVIFHIAYSKGPDYARSSKWCKELFEYANGHQNRYETLTAIGNTAPLVVGAGIQDSGPMSDILMDIFNRITTPCNSVHVDNISISEKQDLVLAYMLSKVVPATIETILYDLGSSTPGFRPFSSIHMKTASKDIIQNNIELKSGYNRVDLSYMNEDILGWAFSTINLANLAASAGLSAISADNINDPQSRRNVRVSVSPTLRPDRVNTYATFQKNAAIRSTFSTPRQYVVANGILGNLINDYYGGEIILNLDPTIREYDIIMLYDDVNDYWGMVQVGAVTHMLSQEYGAVTIIKPDLYTENGIDLNRDTLGTLGTFLNVVDYMMPIISWVVVTKIGFGILKGALKLVGKLFKKGRDAVARSVINKMISVDGYIDDMINKDPEALSSFAKALINKIQASAKTPNASASKMVEDYLNTVFKNSKNIPNQKTLRKLVQAYQRLVKDLEKTPEKWMKYETRFTNEVTELIKNNKADLLNDTLIDDLMEDKTLSEDWIVKFMTRAMNRYLAPFGGRSWFGSINPISNSMGYMGAWLSLTTRLLRISASYRMGKMWLGDPTRAMHSFAVGVGEYFYLKQPITISGLYHKSEPFISNLEGIQKVDAFTTWWDVVNKRYDYLLAPISEISGGIEGLLGDVSDITAGNV